MQQATPGQIAQGIQRGGVQFFQIREREGVGLSVRDAGRAIRSLGAVLANRQPISETVVIHGRGWLHVRFSLRGGRDIDGAPTQRLRDALHQLRADNRGKLLTGWGWMLFRLDVLDQEFDRGLYVPGVKHQQRLVGFVQGCFKQVDPLFQVV